MPPPSGFLADIQKGKKLNKLDKKDINDRSTVTSPSVQRRVPAQPRAVAHPQASVCVAARPAAPARSGSLLDELQRRQAAREAKKTARAAPAHTCAVPTQSRGTEEATPPVPIRVAQPHVGQATVETGHSLHSRLPSPSQARMEDLQRQIASQRSLPTTACADFDGNTEGICALVRFLREHPDLSSTPGIFVESCPTGDPEWVLRKVRSAVSLAMVHDFLEDVNVLSLAQTIKLYLKQREEPLIPKGLNEAVLKAMSPYISRDECVAQLGCALESLDVASWDILREICFMLGEVQNSTAAKLAYSFGPLLLRVELRPSAISSAKDANAAVEALIDERELVFDAVNAPRSTASSKSLSGVSTMSSGSETSSPESPPARRPHPRFGVDLAAHINKLRKPRGSAAKSRAR